MSVQNQINSERWNFNNNAKLGHDPLIEGFTKFCLSNARCVRSARRRRSEKLFGRERETNDLRFVLCTNTIARVFNSSAGY